MFTAATSTGRPTRTLLIPTSVALGIALALAGCSGGSDAASSDSVAGGEAPAVVQEGEVASGSDGAARDVAGAPTITVTDRKVIRNASIAVEVTNLDKGAADLRAIAAASKGQVTSESISIGDPGVIPMPIEPGMAEDKVATQPAEPGTAFVVLTIPAADLDAVLQRIAAVGTVKTRMVSSQEVTGEYVDVKARVESMKASVTRIRALMSQAKNIGDLVALESELSDRQIELDAVQARLQSLDDQIAMSTVTVTLTTPATPVVDEDDNGFLAGLNSGLTALGAAFVIGLTILGAMLPFLVVVAVVLVPVLIWRSRRRASAAAHQSSTTPEPPMSPEPAEAKEAEEAEEAEASPVP